MLEHDWVTDPDEPTVQYCDRCGQVHGEADVTISCDGGLDL